MQWFIFILLLPHFNPPAFEYLWPFADLIFNVGRILSAVVVILLYFNTRRLPSLPIWVIAALEIWTVFTNILNNEANWALWVNIASILTMACAIDLFKRRAAQLVRALMLILEWLIYCNLLSILLTYPQYMYISMPDWHPCYFLGYRNGFFQYVLLAICVSCLYAHIEKKKRRAICLIIASYLCVLITWSATSVAALMLVAVFLLLPLQKLRRCVTFVRVFLATMGVNLLISVFRIMDRVPWVSWFIEKILKKQVTLTGRDYIWDQFWEKFIARPFLGYGGGGYLLEPFTQAHVGAHNQYFQILMEGGVLALILFLGVNFIVGEKLMRYRDSSVCYFFLVALAGLYVVFIAEAYTASMYVYMLLMLAYHVDAFESAVIPPDRRLRIVIKRGSYVPNRKLS